MAWNLRTFKHTAAMLLVTLSIVGCAQTSKTAYEGEAKIVDKGGVVAPQQLCQIALVPGGGPVTVGTAPPLRVAANTNQGCTVQFQGETVVPVAAFNPRCAQINPGAANNILVACPGVPVPANPPTSALVLTFSCQCPAGGLARNARADAYNF